MKIKIKMKNVGDADAIIVLVTDNKEKKYLFLIDGGNSWDVNGIDSGISSFLAFNIDKFIIIATHMDNDHIAGLNKFIEIYDGRKKVDELWVSNYIKMDESLAGRLLREYKELGNHAFTQLNESHDSLVELIDKAIDKGIPIGDFTSSNVVNNIMETYPFIKIYAPYDDMCNRLYNKSDETYEKKNKLQELKEQVNKAMGSKVSRFDEAVSLSNQCSIVFEICIGSKRFLFTGDSDRLKAIHDKLVSIDGIGLRNIHWLKVPHHYSSDEYIKEEIIDIMKPQYSFISAKKPDSKILVRLRQHGKVSCTGNAGDLEHECDENEDYF